MSRGNPALRIRLAPDARERWQVAADAASVSLSAWVRQTVETVLARDAALKADIMRRLRARRESHGK